jgi:aryl-alcohol dehydrogenase-like predicted oxidoreductase
MNAQSTFDPKTDLGAAFPRFSPMVMKNNHPIIEFLTTFGARTNATPAQITLAWLRLSSHWESHLCKSLSLSLSGSSYGHAATSDVTSAH